MRIRTVQSIAHVKDLVEISSHLENVIAIHLSPLDNNIWVDENSWEAKLIYHKDTGWSVDVNSETELLTIFDCRKCAQYILKEEMREAFALTDSQIQNPTFDIVPHTYLFTCLN